MPKGENVVEESRAQPIERIHEGIFSAYVGANHRPFQIGKDPYTKEILFYPFTFLYKI